MGEILFSMEPEVIDRVETKFRKIVTPIPVPDSLPIIEKLQQHEPLSMSGQPLVLWEGEHSTFLDATHVSFTGPMALLVGPEGGFHDTEVQAAVDKGFKPVSLGPRILRSETAALSAMAILQFLSGALSHARKQD